MANSSQKITSFIRQKADHPMKLKELARALGVDDADYGNFRKEIKQLLDSGELVKLKRGRIGVASEMDIQVGEISITRGGKGFLLMEEEDDILIPAHKLHTALDGDRVMVRIKGWSGDRKVGRVIKVMERASRNIVGVFRTGRHFSVVVPDNKRIHRDIYVPQDESLGARDGEKVVVLLTYWEDPSVNPEGQVLERLGFPGEPGVDMLTVIKSYNLPEQFPDDVIDEAEQAAARLTAVDTSNREDCCETDVYTIDPFDAKDHDDAICVEKTATGYRLAVHIADVSHYVEEGSSIDKEALARGNSVYLPGMVIPMIPEVLSNDVCSLKPNRKRLAHSVFIDFDDSGTLLRWRFADTVIRSRAKLSYEDVQEFFDTGEADAKLERVADNLLVARQLARLLNKRRFAEGSLDFDLPESKIILNKKGEVIELGHKVRLESHRLVEEFMLAANRAVALHVFRNAQPFLYRVHDKPDLDRLNEFSYTMEQIGHKFPVSENMRPIQFARFLDRVKDAPEADFINELMLRSMKKAVYQRDNIGHFGLAFSHYTHFTSPIRRYPDLLVHRMLRKLKAGKYSPEFARKAPSLIDRVGRHCSETERQAEAAEREAIKVKQMSFMAKQVGNEFEGVISGVTAYGFFVRLNQYAVEGMVRMSSIDDDYYKFDEKHHRIVGRRTNKVYQLGDKIKVAVVKVDQVAHEMDLVLVDYAKPSRSRRPEQPVSPPRTGKRPPKRKR